MEPKTAIVDPILLKSSRALRTSSSLVYLEKLHRDFLFDNAYPLAPSQAATLESEAFTALG